ncbi:nuclear transport factor 2 family protein [Mycetocola sp. 2940]|uniref:nuclear transport factor 2 family protein n=1 Tax=Mycetocola sp. 2940 TaxID=3156452 RepID=UPI00339A4320
MTSSLSQRTEKILSELVAATNAHDLDALMACFAPDYVNETPAHPSRSFTGSAQVRRNWARLFDAIPDLRAEVSQSVVDGSVAWTEWELSGTRRDGTDHHMRGVMIFTAADGVLTSVRFYMEPVESADGDIDEAISRAAGTSPVAYRPVPHRKDRS